MATGTSCLHTAQEAANTGESAGLGIHSRQAILATAPLSAVLPPVPRRRLRLLRLLRLLHLPISLRLPQSIYVPATTRLRLPNSLPSAGCRKENYSMPLS